MLEPIAGLPHLEVLNLYGTGVTDAGLPALERLASLRSLSLWNTQVTEEGGRRLTQAFEDPERLRQWEQQVADLQHKILPHVPSIQFGPPRRSNRGEGGHQTEEKPHPPLGQGCKKSGTWHFLGHWPAAPGRPNRHTLP